VFICTVMLSSLLLFTLSTVFIIYSTISTLFFSHTENKLFKAFIARSEISCLIFFSTQRLYILCISQWNKFVHHGETTMNLQVYTCRRVRRPFWQCWRPLCRRGSHWCRRGSWTQGAEIQTLHSFPRGI
jgi:hypothetical protein